MHSSSLARRVSWLALSILLGAASRSATAQCAPQWVPGGGLPGTSGTVHTAISWDPDGPGPRSSVLVVGGEFNVVGATISSCVATYDPVSATWGSLGTGLNGQCYALAAMPNGDLVVGGNFTSAGGVAANRVARWNGSTWSPLGSGMNDFVHALQLMPNGDIVAGGQFTTAGGVNAVYAARWNGSTWSPIGSGFLAEQGAYLNQLLLLPNGDLVAVGGFRTAGAATVNRIARWDGTSWSGFGAGMNGWVFAAVLLPNGDLVAGGIFSTAGGVPARGLARWNGSAWSELGSGVSANGAPLPISFVYSLVTEPSGDLLVGGVFNAAGSVPANNVARWNGTGWSALGTGVDNWAYCILRLPNGDVYTTGLMASAGGVPASYIARWDGTHWSSLSSGTNAAIHCFTKVPNGDLIAGGRFTSVGGVVANGCRF